MNDVKWYMNQNSNTMKNGRNPETHEVIDELKEVPPLGGRLDPEEYSSIPNAAGITEKNTTAPVALLTLAVVIAAAAATLVVFRSKKRKNESAGS